MSDFDPLHKWLAIPPAEQPPHHYRLLGISLFEADPDVIATAADRQMAHIKSFASGPHAAQSQWCLNQLSKARVCLLNARHKEKYDRQLQQQLEAQQAVFAAQSVNAAQSVDGRHYDAAYQEDVPVDQLPKIVRVRRRRRPRTIAGLPLLMLAAGAAAVAGLLYYARITAPPSVSTVASVPSHTQPVAPIESPTPPQSAPVAPPGPVAQEPPAGTSPAPRDLQEPIETALERPTAETITSEQPPTEPAVVTWLAALPESISLPSGLSAPGVLWKPAAWADLAHVSLKLDCPAYFGRLGQRPTIIVLAPQNPDECYIFDEPEALLGKLRMGDEDAAARPVASLTLSTGEFHWLEGATTQSRADRLRTCRLILSQGDQHRAIQLCQPQVLSNSLTVGDWREPPSIDIDLATFPADIPAGELQVSVELSEDWPVNRDDLAKLASLRIDTDTRIRLLGAADAGVGVYWRRAGNTLKVFVAPGFGLKSAPSEMFVLSASQLDATERSMQRAGINLQKEYNRRTRGRAKLQANLNAANAFDTRLPGGGTTVPLLRQKQALVAAAQAEIAANEARISEVTALGQTLQQELEQEIPKLRSLAATLQGKAQAWFTVYLPTDEGRVVLFTTKSGEAERSARAALMH